MTGFVFVIWNIPCLTASWLSIALVWHGREVSASVGGEIDAPVCLASVWIQREIQPSVGFTWRLWGACFERWLRLALGFFFVGKLFLSELQNRYS
jgi:hypothetical protein